MKDRPEKPYGLGPLAWAVVISFIVTVLVMAISPVRAQSLLNQDHRYLHHLDEIHGGYTFPPDFMTANGIYDPYIEAKGCCNRSDCRPVQYKFVAVASVAFIDFFIFERKMLFIKRVSAHDQRIRDFDPGWSEYEMKVGHTIPSHVDARAYATSSWSICGYPLDIGSRVEFYIGCILRPPSRI